MKSSIAILVRFYFLLMRSLKLFLSSFNDCLKSESFNLIGTVVKGGTIVKSDIDSFDWLFSLLGDFFSEPELAILVLDCEGELLLLRSRCRNISKGLNFCFKWLSIVYLRPMTGFTVVTVFALSEKIFSCSSWGLKEFWINSLTLFSIPSSLELNSSK